ncbi:MAG: hypothetical protein AB7V27_19235 [Candidatus Binatia bacterium]
MPCWFACNVGPRPHGEDGREWLAAATARIEATPPEPDGSFPASCAEDALYVHADGGAFLRRRHE